MKNGNRCLLLLLCMALLLTGCGLRTMDELYCLPKRSDADDDLQAVIDKAMNDLSYSAPLGGENRQVVQRVDLDGDGVEECLVFAKDNSEKPLKILIFCQLASGYVLMDTIEGYGFAYDFVSFAQIDGKPGMEIIVGRQVSNQVMRAVSVYRFSSEISRRLMSAGYTKLEICDLNGDGNSELLLLNSGEQDGGSGTVSLYQLSDNQLQRTAVADLSGAVENVKRMVSGNLQKDMRALFVTSLADSGQLVTDIFLMMEGGLKNVGYSTAIEPLGSDYMYPEDIDGDEILEIPSLMLMPAHPGNTRPQYYVRWYSQKPDGTQTDKRYTYLNFTNGWYLVMEHGWLSTMSVVQSADACTFYMWDENKQDPQKVMTVYVLTDSDREEIMQEEDYVVLYEGDAVIYAAKLEGNAADHGLTVRTLRNNFYMMRTELITDEK